jgi:Ulp1 family protease
MQQQIIQQLINQRRVPVTADEEDAVSRSINKPEEATVIVTNFNIPMTLSKMACLRPREYSAVHQL